jgi:adenosylhomocysteine nucleosidase
MIGLIAAMTSEMDAIIACLDNQKEHTISGIKMVSGTIGNQDVIVMLSGVGKCNAALSTTILCEHFKLDEIINIGTAGGLKAEEEVLDAVISTQVVQHDFDTSPVDGEAGIGLYFEANQAMIERAVSVLEQNNVRVHCGLVASGDQFVARNDQLERLATYFPDAICAEMEAGAVAAVCAHYQIPFVVIRSLSDVACREDSEMDFSQYVVHAAKRSAQFVSTYVASLG